MCQANSNKFPQIQDEQILSTASELYLAKALSLEKSSACKMSILAKTQSEEKQALQKIKLPKCLDQQLGMLDKSIQL